MLGSPTYVTALLQ